MNRAEQHAGRRQPDAGFWMPAISGAVLGGILGGLEGAARIAWQGWSLDHVVIAVLCGAAVGFAAGVAYAVLMRARADEVAAQGRRWGFRYDARVDRGEYPTMNVFSGWSAGTNRLAGDLPGAPVEIFDLELDTGGESERISRTVFLVELAGIPACAVRPRRIAFDGFLGAIGLGGLGFDPRSAADPSTAATIAEFNRRFVVAAADEAGARALLTPEVMIRLLRHPKWSFECRDGRLAAWQDRLVPVSDYAVGLARILDIRATLCDGVNAADVPAIAVPDAGALVTRCGRAMGLMGFLCGASLGTVLGWALLLQSLDRFPDEWRRLVAAIGLGGPLVGAVIGIAIGFCIGRSIAARTLRRE